MVKVSIPNRFQFRMMPEIRGFIFPKRGGEIHYIGGAEILPAPLTIEEEEQIMKKLGGDEDKEARSNLIEHNLRLVVYIAKKFDNTGVGVEDLISIGTIGLIKAIDSFDEKKGSRLVTYAAKCIDNELLMMFRSEKKRSKEISLNEPLGTDKEGNKICFQDVTFSEDEDVVERLQNNEDIIRLRKAFDSRLTDRERKIIAYRYGLYGNRPRTQRELAAEYGISRSYVSRIEKKALEKMREVFEE